MFKRLLNHDASLFLTVSSSTSLCCTSQSLAVNLHPFGATHPDNITQCWVFIILPKTIGAGVLMHIVRHLLQRLEKLNGRKMFNTTSASLWVNAAVAWPNTANVSSPQQSADFDARRLTSLCITSIQTYPNIFKRKRQISTISSSFNRLCNWLDSFEIEKCSSLTSLMKLF